MTEAKAELLRAWLAKAGRDLDSARLLANAEPPLFETALYHCQQAAEKALKAFLLFHDRPLEKTHNLGRLIEMAGEIDLVLLTWEDAARHLSPYAFMFRYPGIDKEPTLEDAREALGYAEAIFRQIVAYFPEI